MIFGTAGHIDHGKTALVKAITGIETSRLKEEKRRGITIDLGFAYWPQPDGTVIGFVDVPGHERFIHTMLAGAAGIDCALLVIAADDGIMPQTREHLRILSLLGVTSSVVALTKTDIADAERVADVTREITKALDPAGLGGAGIFPVSSLTGAGIAALKAALLARAAAHQRRGADGRFRLSIDRSFTLTGAGTVVTGTVLSGRIAIGDQVIVSPQGLEARVRAIHAQNADAAEGHAGDRCALNLAGVEISKEAVSRGDVALDPFLHQPADRIDAIAELALPANIKLRQWLPVRLHSNAAERGARLVFLEDAAALGSGSERLIQLVVDKPIAAAHGDRFILRDQSAQVTLGGGRFLDIRAPQRHRRSPARIAALHALRGGSPAAIARALLRLPPHHIMADDFARAHAQSAEQMAALFQALSAVMIAAPDGVAAMAAAEWLTFRRGLTARLQEHHAANPDQPGAPLSGLRLAVAPLLPPQIFKAALLALQKLGDITLEGAWARLPGHQSKLSHEDESLWARIAPLLAAGGSFRPPRGREIAAALGLDHNRIRLALKRFARRGEIFEIEADHFYPRAMLAAIAAAASEAAAERKDGLFTAAELRDRLRIGRRTAILLLEFFDRHGVTLRRGDTRRMNPRRPGLFGGEG